MEITLVEAAVDELPQDIPSPRFRISSVFTILVRVTTADGVHGIGFAYTWDAPSARAVAELVRGMTPYVLGEDVARIRVILDKLERLYVNFLSTSGLAMVSLSALDMAIWDASCRAIGQPVQRLLGMAREKVPVYASADLWPTLSPEECAVAAKGLAESGFSRMKMWVASPDIAYERDRVAAVRDAIGPSGTLMVDAAQAYDVSTAIRFAAAVEHLNLNWFEDPVHYEDLAGLQTVSRHCTIPLATGEHSYGVSGLKVLLDTGAVRTVLVDLERIGGVTGFLGAAALCEAYRVNLTTHVYPHTSARLMTTAKAATLCEFAPLWDAMFGRPLIEDGYIIPAVTPGVTEDLVKTVEFETLGSQ